MTRSLSDSRVSLGDEVLHKALDRILAFGREKGRDHRVVMNTTVAILDALIVLSDIEERDAEAQRPSPRRTPFLERSRSQSKSSRRIRLVRN
jgi:hypothetical protein